MTERTQRISYFPLTEMDSQMMAVMNRCAVEGTPRPESSAVRAHSQAAFWTFDQAWDRLFRNGVVDHSIKELCRVFVSRSVKCEYCGNQRSEAAHSAGVSEGKLDELLNFETSGSYSERERAALSYAEAITWRLDPDESFWERLHAHYSEEELVELACFISLTMGQQSWIRLLDIDHHEVMAGSAASMAPGFEDKDASDASKQSSEYWGALKRS
ncbi:MAG: carboxymuconolactone decarboxylase family protein [Acidimicrobiales bacterium]